MLIRRCGIRYPSKGCYPSYSSNRASSYDPCTCFCKGDCFGKISIYIAKGIARGNCGLSTQCRAGYRACRLGGKGQGCCRHIHRTAGAVGHGAGGPHLGATDGEVSIAVYAEDIGQTFSQTSVVGVVGADGVVFATAIGNGDTEA